MNRVLKIASAGLIATVLPMAAFAQGNTTTSTTTNTAAPMPDAKAGTPAAITTPAPTAMAPTHDSKTPATHAAAPAHDGKAVTKGTVAKEPAKAPMKTTTHTQAPASTTPTAKTAPGAS